MQRILMAGAAILLLAGCSKQESQTEGKAPEAAPAETATAAAPQASETPATPAAPAADIPAGSYVLDKSHASLTFKLSHLGFSNYTAQFTSFDSALTLDPANAAASSVTATIDPNSLDLPSPPPGFKEELLGKNFLDAATYPEMSFKSTSVEATGANTAHVTGDFTLHGVTKPVVLDVTFNGGYRGIPNMDPNPRIGFSAQGAFKRSDFGIGFGVPAPGTTMGVGDEVTVMIDAEFTGTAPAPAPEPAAQ